MSFWQTLPHKISPVFLKLGSFELRWYGLLFLSAIVVAYLVSQYRVRTERPVYTAKDTDDYFTWAAFGVIFGGRLGYVFFYNLPYFLQHPLEIFLPFNATTGAFTGIGGMSFHGGLLGVFLATFLFAKKHSFSFWHLIDFMVVGVPAGHVLGRLGNFLNGELWGRVTSVPWAMTFPGDPTGALRHPSQLYSAFLEGVLVFLIVWAIRKRAPFNGAFFCFYLMTYGVVRFLVEFFREPDAHLGFVFFSLSMGQLLCVGMALIGMILFLVLKRHANKSLK